MGNQIFQTGKEEVDSILYSNIHAEEGRAVTTKLIQKIKLSNKQITSPL